MQFQVVARDGSDEDPYVTEGVWQEIEIAPFRAAVGSLLPSSGDVSR